MRIRLLAITSFAAGMLGTPQNGTYFSLDGNTISYVPLIQGVGREVGNAPTNDHQRATALITSRTNDDSHSQENTLGVETAIATGRSRPWTAQTVYSNLDNVFVPRGQLPNGTYRQVSGRPCRSGTSSPVGFGDAGQKQVDATCIWQWINLPNVGGKVGIYSEETVGPGAGNSWNLALNTLLKPNTPLSFHTNAQFDFGNNSGECFLDSNCINVEVKSGGAFRSTHGVLIDTENAGPTYALHYGLRLAGTKLDSDADVESDSSGSVGFGICSTGFVKCFHGDAAIKDQSESPVGLKLAGKYAISAIAAPGFRVDNDGAVTSDKSIRSKYFAEELYTPSSSTAPCKEGQFADDSNFHYVCVSENHWKRVALSSF